MFASASCLARFLNLSVQSIPDEDVKSLAHLSLFHVQCGLTHCEVSSAATKKPTTKTPSGPSIVEFHFENFLKASVRSHRLYVFSSGMAIHKD